MSPHGPVVFVGSAGMAQTIAEALGSADLVVAPTAQRAVAHLTRARTALLLIEVGADPTRMHTQIRMLRELSPNAAVLALCAEAPDQALLLAGVDDFLMCPAPRQALKMRVELVVQRRRDVQRLADAQDALGGQRRIDPATGALTAEEFERRVERAFGRAKRFDHAVTLVVLELERSGAAVVDLRELGRLAGANLRETDHVGRRGHGFVLALSGCPMDQTIPILERIQVQFAISSHRRHTQPPSIRVGLADAQLDQGVAESIWRAERALAQHTFTGLGVSARPTGESGAGGD